MLLPHYSQTSTRGYFTKTRLSKVIDKAMTGKAATSRRTPKMLIKEQLVSDVFGQFSVYGIVDLHDSLHD